MMQYVVYKTKNLKDNREYIGVHSTEDVNDNYLGSGTHLKLAIAFYGLDSFSKEILYTFNTKKEAYDKEAELVNEEYVNRKDTYNMKIGGQGGWDHTHSIPDQVEKRRAGNKKAIEEGRAAMWRLSPEKRSQMTSGENNGFYGKTHSKEARKKIAESKKMDETILKERIQDFQTIEKKYGYISKLAQKWNISHTQVKRFLKQNNLI